MPKSNRHASSAPAKICQFPPGRGGRASALDVAAVLDTVSVAVPAVVLVMLTGVVVPKLNVGGSCAPLGLEATTAVSTTLPVKPPLGVTAIVEVFPVVAPGLMDTAAPETVNERVAAAVTVTEAVPLAVP
jgi:hypothetical protein